MTAEIKLQNGMIALIDEEDFERVNEKCVWSVKEGDTSNTLKVYDGSSRSKAIYLGRFILGLEGEEKIFHKDRNPLNFTKENLVIVEQREITRKRKGNRNSSSKYKGVSWASNLSKWKAQIRVNDKTIVLGYFECEDIAALTYNEAAKEMFGEFAYQNVIGEDNSANTFKTEKVKQKRKRNKTGYKGIYERDGKYLARVWNGKRFVYAGVSHDPIEAAKMHDRKAYELFGDKAVLNFPYENNM